MALGVLEIKAELYTIVRFVLCLPVVIAPRKHTMPVVTPAARPFDIFFRCVGPASFLVVLQARIADFHHHLSMMIGR